MNSAERKIGISAKLFISKVWPAIGDSLGGGQIIPVESVTDSAFAKMLDVVGGIDMWQLWHGNQFIRGLGSRVQWNNVRNRDGNLRNTFTVRAITCNGSEWTEYQKRLHAIEIFDEQNLYPAITIQAYVDGEDGPLLSAAWIHTNNLYCVFAQQWDCLPLIPNREDGAQFKALHWSLLKNRGIWIHDRESLFV